jgi:hypothetical protein
MQLADRIARPQFSEPERCSTNRECQLLIRASELAVSQVVHNFARWSILTTMLATGHARLPRSSLSPWHSSVMRTRVALPPSSGKEQRRAARSFRTICVSKRQNASVRKLIDGASSFAEPGKRDRGASGLRSPGLQSPRYEYRTYIERHDRRSSG